MRNININLSMWHVACLAHARRKFYEASIAMNHQSRAYDALQQIKAIYKNEHECKHLDDDQRKAYRLMHAKPFLGELKQWADAQINLQVTEKGLLGKALYYLVKHWAHSPAI